MKNYCTAIGYPIGLGKMGDGLIGYCLEFQNRTILLSVEELMVWNRIAKHDIDSTISTNVIATLKKKDAVVWCNTQDSFEQRLQGYSPIRQGYSAIDENGGFVVYLGNLRHKLSPVQLQLWMCADGINPLSTFVIHIQESDAESWTEAVCTLVGKELICLR